MKFHVPRRVLFGLFAFAAVGSASATQMKDSTPAFATQASAVQTPVQAAGADLPKRDVRCGARGAARGTLIALHPGAFWIAYTKPYLQAFCRRMAGGGFRVVAVAYPPNSFFASSGFMVPTSRPSIPADACGTDGPTCKPC